jgi:hypothetical protein
MKKGKNFVLIENKNQALEYLKNKEKFSEAIPITFSFEPEKILKEKGIYFKTEDEYDIPSDAKGSYDLILKNSKKILENLKIEYRGIELFRLYYMDLFDFLGISYRYLTILKRFSKVEEIEEIFIFNDVSNNSIKNEMCSRIARNFFKEKAKIINFSREEMENSENSFFIRQVGKIQNIFAKIDLFFSKKKNKIFLCGHQAFYESLIKELNKNKKNEIFRCHDHLQKSFIIDKKIFFSYEFEKKKTKHQVKLKKEIEDFLDDENKFSFFKKLDFEEEILFVLKNWIEHQVKYEFMKFSGIINKMFELMKKKKINLICVYADTTTFEKALVQVGKLFGISSVVLLHGLLGKGVQPAFFPMSADYILAFGQGTKERLINLEVPEEKIIITGSPQYDKFAKKEKNNLNKKISFIMSCPDSHYLFPEIHITKKRQKEVLRMLFKTMKKFPDYKLSIKGRKDWDMNELVKIIAREENFENFEFEINPSPIEFLKKAKIIIVNVTTMVLDGLLLEKPAISIWFKDIEKFTGYKDSKAIATVHTQKELEKAIREKIKEETEKDKKFRKEWLEYELFKLDGKSGKRSANFIEKIMLNKNAK